MRISSSVSSSFLLGSALLASVISASACKGDGEKSSAEGAVIAKGGEGSSQASGKLYEKGMGKKACEMLTPEMVAKIAKVPVGQIEQQAVSSFCLYSWDGGKASMMHVRVYKDLDQASSRFANAYSNKSGAEISKQVAAMGDVAAAKAVAGKDVASSAKGQTAKVVTSALTNSMASGMTYDSVPNLGDAAMYETTRHATTVAKTDVVSYANQMQLLTGNLKFSLSYSLNAKDGQGAMYKDEAIALTKLVLEQLPNL